MCPWLSPPVFWLQSHRAWRQCRLLHSLLQDDKGEEWIAENSLSHLAEWRHWEREMWYHTDEVLLHLLQHWLHVITAQALGAHQALQHPKHAPKAATLFGAEENMQSLILILETNLRYNVKIYWTLSYLVLLVPLTTTFSSSSSSSISPSSLDSQSTGGSSPSMELTCIPWNTSSTLRTSIESLLMWLSQMTL